MTMPGVVVIGLGGGAALNWPKASTAGANPDDPSQVSLGSTIYANHCATCHGANLEGHGANLEEPDWRVRMDNGRFPAPPHDQSGHTWHHADEQLFQITRLGVKPPLAPEGYESDMPAFGDTLSDEQMWAVLAFIKSTWPPETRARQARRNTAATQ